MALLQANRTVELTLVANVVTTIQCLTPINGFRIFNRDLVSPVYFRTDNVDPVGRGDRSFMIPPNSVKWATNLLDAFNAELRLVSTGLAVLVTVEGDEQP